MKKALALFVFSAILSPSITFAQSTGGLMGLIDNINVLINRLLPLIITLTVVFFLWGIFKYVVSGGDSTARKEALGFILWGIIALFVMVSVWGLVNILTRTIGPDNQPPVAPLPVQEGGQYR